MLRAEILESNRERYNLGAIKGGILPPELLAQVEARYEKVRETKSKSEADFLVMRSLAATGMGKDDVFKAFAFPTYSFHEKYRAELKRGKAQARHYLELTWKKASEGAKPLENGKIRGILDDFLIRNVLKNIPKLHRVESPFKFLNDIGGYVGFTTFLGAPKVCKSLIALQSAVVATQDGVATLYVDFENGVHRTNKRLGAFDNYDEDLFYYMNIRGFSSENLEKMMGRISGNGKRQVFVIIDSIQKIPTRASFAWEDTRQWLLVLERLKIEFPCVVMAISEKKRQYYSESALGAGKGSGSIEYNSDMVVNVDRDEAKVFMSILAHRDVLITRKNGFGEYKLNNGVL